MLNLDFILPLFESIGRLFNLNDLLSGYELGSSIAVFAISIPLAILMLVGSFGNFTTAKSIAGLISRTVLFLVIGLFLAHLHATSTYMQQEVNSQHVLLLTIISALLAHNTRHQKIITLIASTIAYFLVFVLALSALWFGSVMLIKPESPAFDPSVLIGAFAGTLTGLSLWTPQKRATSN